MHCSYYLENDRPLAELSKCKQVCRTVGKNYSSETCVRQWKRTLPIRLCTTNVAREGKGSEKEQYVLGYVVADIDNVKFCVVFARNVQIR